MQEAIVKSITPEFFTVNWYERKDGKEVVGVKKIYFFESFVVISSGPKKTLWQLGCTIYFISLYN